MNEPIKVILAEDEIALGVIVKESLETRNFKVTFCTNGEEALEAYRQEVPEILVLDVMMPKKNGFSLAKAIREVNAVIPIIFLTSKSQTKDVIEGFEHGGNDYLKKPFSIEELIVRIHALLNRVTLAQDPTAIQIGKFNFNSTLQSLSFNDIKITLTHRESQILFRLVAKKNQVLERSEILKQLWGDDNFFNGRSLDVFITKLRKKLNNDPGVQIINVRSYGYKLIC